MKGRRLLIFLLLAGSAAAQFDAAPTLRSVRVRVTFANGGCDPGTQVTLLGRVSVVAEVRENEQCVADFFDVPVGTYDVRLSGGSIANPNGGTIELTPTGLADFEATVRRASAAGRSYGAPGNAFVSASDLAIPARARKEHDKANELIAKQEFAKAEDHLRKAIALYPTYASAYNSLGVVYARRGDREHEREALQKAITINHHFAPAYVNLGRMNISSRDFQTAENFLTQASTVDPMDTMSLVLLAYAELMDRHFDDAIATSRKAHALERPHALVHRVAANAFEQKKQAADAITELDLFLKEEPTGAGADDAHKALALLRGILHMNTTAPSNTASVAAPAQSKDPAPSSDR